VGALVAATPASASPITGTLSLDGSDTFTATSITFVNPANIGGESGSFSVLANCFGCVTLDNFNSGSTNFQVYSATEGAITTTLTLASATFSETSFGGLVNLDVTGIGIATLTGFDPTPGEFLLTTQGQPGGATFTFSSTTLAIPEPASLALFGTALAGLACLTRRRRKAI
jgi:hypothetical protein